MADDDDDFGELYGDTAVPAPTAGGGGGFGVEGAGADAAAAPKADEEDDLYDEVRHRSMPLRAPSAA